MTDNERALAAYNALQQHFSAGSGLYRQTCPARPGERFAYIWPFSRALAATVDLACSADSFGEAIQDILGGLAHYWDARPTTGLPGYSSAVRPPRGRPSGKSYDDNAWPALSLVRVFRMTGNLAALRRARQVFEFAVGGWAGNSRDPAAGGVYWQQQARRERNHDRNHDRNTCSNAPTAELGLLLYAATRDPYCLTWARRIYDWVDAHLRDPRDSLYWDHVLTVGPHSYVVETTKWSYNQGTMLGASVLLHRVAGDPAGTCLARARAIAEAALRHYDGHYPTQDPAFNAIFFRNLLLLHPLVADDPSLRERMLAAMRSYADWAWDTVRDAATDLFWFKRAAGHVRLIDQAAMVEMYACLACDPARYELLG